MSPKSADEVISTSKASGGAQSGDCELTQAENLYKDDKLLEAARLLKTVEESRLTNLHQVILEKAVYGEGLVTDLKSNVDGNEWKKQGESHGVHQTLIYYKLDKSKKVKLTARLETPIDKSLLVPILSVLNETELYQSWLPNWSTPRLRIKRCTKLQQTGRVSQIILVTIELPWPISNREVVLSAIAFDDIDENGDIGIHLRSLDTGDENGIVPPPDKDGTVRVDFNGGFLFRKCPDNHPLLLHYDLTDAEGKNEFILVSFSMCVDPKINFLPQSFINFMIRVAIGTMWNMFLQVADDVKNGKRPAHAKLIQKKRSILYDWVDSRVQSMLQLVKTAAAFTGLLTL